MNISDNLSLDSAPLLLKEFINDAEFLATHSDMEFCINHPWQYTPSIIHRKLGSSLPLKFKHSSWYSKNIVDKRQVLDFVNLGHTLTIENYSVHSEATQEVCKRFEAALKVSCDMHVDFALGAVNDYSKRTEYPMFVIQVQGETSWKVFDKHTEIVYNNKVSQETATIDTILKPGDMLYIPKDTVYSVSPFEKRISISVPCDVNSLPIDRRNLKLNEN